LSCVKLSFANDYEFKILSPFTGNLDCTWKESSLQTLIEDSMWLVDPVEDSYDPTGGLPADPTVGDRYISDATANGWTIDYIYEWDGTSWVESIPEEGWMVWMLLDLLYYVFFSGGWMEVGAGSYLSLDGESINVTNGTFDLTTTGDISVGGVTVTSLTDGIATLTGGALSGSTIADGTTMATNGAPVADAGIANKKYVDDVVVAAGGAPIDATYITQTANGTLTAEQALTSLSDGIVKVNGTTGVLSTAIADTDYDSSTTNEINTITGDDSNSTTGLGITVAGSGINATTVAGNTVTVTATEADTLDTVSDRGSTTDQSITTGGYSDGIATLTGGALTGLTTPLTFGQGGTGLATWTQYLIPYADTATSIGQIAIGTATHVLTSNGVGVAPTFQAAAGGAPEGTAVLSTGPVADTNYLRADGDGTCSWQTPAGAGDLLADGSVPLAADWDAGNSLYDITAVEFKGALKGQADTVATITTLAPDTATTQATQASITTCANLTTTGALNAGSITSGFTSIDVGAGAIDGGVITADTNFTGALTGNVTGDASGSSGSCTGESATVTNATLTTALTVNTGAVTLIGNAGASTLTLGAGANSFSGTASGTNTGGNTGDNTVATSGDSATDFFDAGEIIDARISDTLTSSTCTGNAATVTNGVYTTDFPLNQNTTGKADTAGNADTVTNATLTTALTVNTGAVTLIGNAGASTLTLGAGANSFSGTASGTNTGGNTGDDTVCTSGAATTAETLKTARAINGVDFNGSQAITVTAAAGTLTGATLKADVLASSLTSLGTIASLVATTADINAGTVDATIGGTTPASGSFTEVVLSADGKLEFNPTPSATDKATGIIVSMTVDVNTVGIGGLLHLDTDSHWVDADMNATTSMPCMGIALGTTGTVDVLLNGIITDTAWTWTVGGIMYVNTAGTMTQTAPAGNGDQVQVVGIALTATTVYFNPSGVLVEVVV